jgi:hypothetical protein
LHYDDHAWFLIFDNCLFGRKRPASEGGPYNGVLRQLHCTLH